ncbi:copper chaperone PCu(A)C [Halothiobacillus sp.]|uniref:copper chaperone PCu(A)C n=1 Tax=Halothiobacillus sp. TaxID=1891311 RepID=UPI00261A1730|nr:copper chaperone PCu(A)C [Halothiobacillus sp.]MDD4965715.1 copper chaperone PCu(A)C [Halothiobacillus sp.]
MKRMLVGSLFMAMSGGAFAAPVISDAWIPEQPPGAMANAVFLNMNNQTDKPEALVKAEAPGFKLVQLHKSIEVNGMHKMIEQKEIVVPAHGETRLAPGGYHIMLIQPEKRLQAGDSLPVTLTFADGSHETITVPVKKRPAMPGMMKH